MVGFRYDSSTDYADYTDEINQTNLDADPADSQTLLATRKRINEEHSPACCRLDLNEPPTAVGGI